MGKIKVMIVDDEADFAETLVERLETLSLIKKLSPGIEVILVTGDGSTTVGMEGMRMGLSDYLMKPIDIGITVDRIRTAAARRRSRR